MITKTIKAAGGDYTSINTALTANNNLTDDTDLIVGSDIAETNRYTGTINLNGYRLRIYPDIPHQGNIGVGRKISSEIAFNRYIYMSLNLGVGGEVHLYGLEITSADYNYTNKDLVFIRALSGSGNLYFHNNICNCATNADGYGAYGVVLEISQDKTIIAYNNKVYKGNGSGLKFSLNSGSNCALIAENNTVDDCNFIGSSSNGGIYIASTAGSVAILKNNVATRNGYKDFRFTYASPEFQLDNNSDADGSFVNYTPFGTGHNNLSTTIVPIDNFLSLDLTNEDYLKIGSSSADLKDTGIIPNYAISDIAGVSRWLDGLYSRGCYEYNESLQAKNVLDSNLYIIGKYLDDAEDDAGELLTELFPDTTTLLMENFEKTFNLKSTGTTEERRNRILSAHRQRGGLSKAYFEGIGNTLGDGVYTVSIAEGTGGIPFIVAPRSIYTSPKGPATPIPGAVSNSDGTDTPYHITVTVTGSASEPELEKLYERLKPPWTIWTFNYIP